MSEVMIKPSVRDVEVKIPTRMTMFNSGAVSEYNLSKMIDPLACSEIARLEEEVRELKRKIYELSSHMETYKKVTENLAIELGVLHKAMPLRGTHADIQKAINATSSLFRVSTDNLMSKDRTTEVAHARMACMYVFRDSLGMGLKTTGKLFNRDHGTVAHAFKKVTSLMKADKAFKRNVEELRKTVLGNVGNQNKQPTKGNNQ